MPANTAQSDPTEPLRTADLPLRYTENGTSGNITITNGQKLLVDPSGASIGGNPPLASAGLDLEGGTITDNGMFEQGISEAGSHSGGAALIVNRATITGGPLIAVSGSYAPLSGMGSGVTFSGSGSGTFTFVGSSSANATSIGGTIGTHDTVVLSANAANGSVPVDITSNVTNDGTIKLTDSDASSGGNVRDFVLIDTGDTLTNNGTILSDPGPGGQGTRVIDGQSATSGTLDNAAGGTITVNQDLQIDDGQAGVFTTSGNITIASGEKLLDAPNGGFAGGNPVVYSPVLNIAGGTITDNGTFSQGISEASSHAAGGALNVTGGAITGGGGLTVDDGGSVNFSGAGSGAYTFEGAGGSVGSLAGTIASGQTLALSASNALGSVELDAAADVTNNGTIEFTDPDAPGGTQWQARIRMTGGATLSNNGTIVADPGGGRDGFYALDGNLTNASGGTIDVNQTLEVDTQTTVASNFETSGTVNVASGQTLYVNPAGNASVFTISGGTVNDSGHVDENISPTNGQALVSGGLTVADGTVTGNPVLAGDVGASFAGNGSGTFVLVGRQNLLSGNVDAGCTVVLSGSASGAGASTLTAGASFTNNGTIELTDPDASGSGAAQSLLAISSGTLTNDGIIVSDPGAAGQGSRLIQGNIANNGTLEVNDSLQQSGGVFANGNTVQIAGGQTLGVAGTYTQSAGTTSLGGSGATLTPASGVALQGGILSGSGTVSGNLTNGGEVQPSPSPATIAVSGTYTQSAGGLLALTNTAGGSDRLNITGAATLGGTLQVTTASGFSPTSGSSFKALIAASVSGRFATVADSGIYSVAYDPADVTLTTVAQAEQPSLSIADATVQAPAYGNAQAVFTVTLSSPQSSPVTVDYASVDNTAVINRDYLPVDNRLTFAPGQTQQTISVQVIGGTFGPNLTFFVDLSNPSGAVLGTARATGTITHQSTNVGAVSPSTGGNAGTVTLTIQGSGFYGAPTVALTAPGRPTLTASAVTGAPDGSSLTATFDLSGAALGVRAVVITEPGGGGPETVPAAFTIVPAEHPAVSVQLAGAPAVGRFGIWWGELLYQNVTNVDAYGTIVQISGFPPGTSVTASGVDPPTFGDVGNERTMTIGISHIPAGGSGAVPLTFEALGDAGAEIDLYAHVMGTSGNPSSGENPSVVVNPSFTTTSSSELAGDLEVSDGTGATAMPFALKLVAPPSDGQTVYSHKTSGDTVDAHLLVPPGPPAQPFPKYPPTVAPVVAAALRHRPEQAHSANVIPGTNYPSWVDDVLSATVSWYGKVSDAQGIWDQTQEAAHLKQISSCLGLFGFISPTGHGPGILGTDSGQSSLDAAANAATDIAIASLIADFAVDTNPAESYLAGKFESALESAANSAWGIALYNQLAGDSGTLSGGPGQYKPFGGFVLNDPAATLANVIKFCDPPPKRAPDPPAFPIQIRSSLDPNDMVGPSGPGPQHWVRGTPRLPFTYTATFQNLPKATAPAYRVVITDRLPRSRLDLSTMSLGPIRFGTHVLAPPAGVQHWSTTVDLRPASQTLVDVAASLNRATGVLTWQLTTIDASTGQPVTDVLHGFLPPDTHPPAGDGSVSFTVTPRAGLRTGRRIANGAVIVFDTNAPIATPTWVNTIDRSRPTSRIVRVAAGLALVKGRLHGKVRGRRLPAMLVRWTGADRFSGIGSFDVYAATDTGRFRQIDFRTPSRHGKFVCVKGRRYRFYTVARSAVGFIQIRHSRSSRPVSCR